jgi:release factor glutamine methyltransferase
MYATTLMNIKQLLDSATKQLGTSSDSPKIDAEILLAHTLKKSRTFLYTWPQQLVDAQTQQHFAQLLSQRLAGEPVAHITGEREFWSLKLQITADTLIPRPETELLVEQALQLLPDTSIAIVDLGTGSGAIALALASERPQWQITAVDQSAAALDIARANAKSLAIHNIRFIHGNWFEPLANQQFHTIISNPPYIATNDKHLAQGDVQFEPASALISGADGLDDIRHIAQQAVNYLLAGGLLIIEHGYDQQPRVKEIFQAAGFTNIAQLVDLGGMPRLTLGYKA